MNVSEFAPEDAQVTKGAEQELSDIEMDDSQETSLENNDEPQVDDNMFDEEDLFDDFDE